MAKPTNYRGIHISVTYAMGYDYYEISQINKGKKWNDKTLFATLKEAKMYIDERYDELIKNESKKFARKPIEESSVGYYIYEKPLDDKYAYCDKSKFTEEGFYLIEDYMLDAIHIFDTKKEAEKFIDENIKHFMINKDDVVIAEYPSTKRGFFESKKSARKSLKESENFVNYIAIYKNGGYLGYVANEDWKLTQDVSEAMYFEKENDAYKFISKAPKSFDDCDLQLEGTYLRESKKSARKSIKENKYNFSVYDFIDYMIETKCIDDVMDYVDFDITQKDFDDALDDLGYDFKIIKKENPHDSIDGIKYYIYQYQIDDEIYRIWVDETGFVLDACLKY